MASGGGSGKWVVVAVLVIAAGLGGFYAGRPDLFCGLLDSLGSGAVPDLARSHVEVGYVDLRRDSHAGITSAIDNFEKALALAPEYPVAMAALCEAHLAQAEYLAEEADDLKAELVEGDGKGEGAEVEGKVAELRRRADRHREDAFRYGSQAIKIDPEGVATLRAMADYYRVTRAHAQMQDLLARAEAVAPTDPGLAYVRGSAAAEDPTSAERAIRYLDTALERLPRWQRARYKLARAHLSLGDRDAARLHLAAILEEVPDHERAQALFARLDAPEPKPEPEPEKPEPKRSRERPRDEPGEGPYALDRLFHRAERLRRADLPTRALPVYFQALDLEPSDAEVLNGIGWCYVDLEQPTTAISYFERARGIEPGSGDAHIGLAEAYKMKGMKRDAVRNYRRYLELEPYGSEASVARQMLRKLEQ